MNSVETELESYAAPVLTSAPSMFFTMGRILQLIDNKEVIPLYVHIYIIEASAS
jgi:hypothetical protein